MGSGQHLSSGGLKYGDGIGDFMRFTSDAPPDAAHAGKDQPRATETDLVAATTGDSRGSAKGTVGGVGR